MKIVSVDIGLKNFGVSVYCTRIHKFTSFWLLQLHKPKDLVAKMKELSEGEPFVSADVVLVENQMRQCMKTMAVALRCFNYDKTVRVAPQSVKRFFNTSMKSHSKNKKAGVAEARKHLCASMQIEFDKFKKKDDIADCVLQTIWFVSTRL